jgi:hypothetical protein
MLKESCPYHKGPVKHTLEECDMLRRYYKPGPSADDGKKKGPNDNGDNQGKEFPNVDNRFMIFGGQTVSLFVQRKQERQEVFSVEATTSVYLDWSDTAITFDQDNHPNFVPSPEKYPLVVDPVIDNTRLSKVLIDVGNSLNIIYAETLELMGISQS